MKYYRFNARARHIHIASRQDQRKTWFPCGKWKFTHRMEEKSRPESIEDVCKGCRRLYNMNVNRQGESECMLTTISALSRVPIDEVRRMGLEFSGYYSWSDLCIPSSHNVYWKTVRYLRKKTGLLTRKIPTNKKEFAKGNRRKVLPEGKEGSITSEVYEGKQAHIDPFSNGLVWGTFNEKPVTLEEYRRKIAEKDCFITGIWH